MNNKKINVVLLFIALSCFASSEAFGQHTVIKANNSSFKNINTVLGLKVGYKRSIFANQLKGKIFDFINGYQVGFFLERRQGDIFSISLGGNYSASGSDISAHDQKIKLSYLKFNLVPTLNWKNVYVGTGLYYGTLLSAEEINDPRGYYPYFEVEKMHKTEWGALFCLGVRVLRIFKVEVQYELGLTSILDRPVSSAAGPRFDTLWIRSRTSGLNVGFIYYLWENNR